MGYKMPMVTKEIYLPIEKSYYSFEEYKKLYGIDVMEIFGISFEYAEPDWIMRVDENKSKNKKFYFINNGRCELASVSASDVSISLKAIVNENTDMSILLIMRFDYDMGITISSEPYKIY